MFFVSIIFCMILSGHLIQCGEFRLKPLSNMNRVIRGSSAFENFLLKASKSVPRIGRRNYYDMNSKYLTDDWNLAKDKMPCIKITKTPDVLKVPNDLLLNTYLKRSKKHPPVVPDIPSIDLAEKIEYYPELFSIISNENYNSEERNNRPPLIHLQNQEIEEVRAQPEVSTFQ